jgi:hypothetical protein
MPEFVLDCPTCSGSLVFQASQRGAGRLYSRCGSCATAYSLWGGRLLPLEGPVHPTERRPLPSSEPTG